MLCIAISRLGILYNWLTFIFVPILLFYDCFSTEKPINVEAYHNIVITFWSSKKPVFDKIDFVFFVINKN